MHLEMIFACNKNGIIGNKGGIPWHVQEDLIRFKKLTTNGIVVMGRKTFESLPNGILKNRINIVITKNYLQYKSDDDTLIFTDMSNVMKIIDSIQKETNKRVFIIGGREIYYIFLKYCHLFHLTLIHDNSLGDTIFPYNIELFKNKTLYINIETSELLYSKNNNIPYQYFTYKSL
jgi:dihydrofolate reductase